MMRSRIIFFAILGAAIIVVVALLVVQNNERERQRIESTLAAQATATALVVPVSPVTSVEPIYTGGTVPTDNLPRYVCAADAFGSYYALQQMQVAGIDVQNGFRLGIVPFLLDDVGGQYDISEEARAELLKNGALDCLFTTLDSVALKGQGAITAIIDESAGADQLWVREGVQTLNDLRGKRITFASGSVGQFFVLYTLAVAGMNPRNDVTLVPADSVAEAVQKFNDGQADVVSGWEPDILEAAKSGGKHLIGSDKLRVIVDVIVTSRAALSAKPRVVQQFHNAWFQTLKAQFENFPTAARQIAGWGNNDWSGISVESAEQDLGSALANIAQAGLSQNRAVMNDTAPLVNRLETARTVWAAAGQATYSGSVAELINPQYVLNARSDLQTTASPRNTTFLLGSRPDLREIAPDEGETLAVLPCRKFDFLPESSELTSESQRILDSCVIPVLSSSTGIYLRVVGSAAWPGPVGTYTEQDILEVAQARAQSVVDYLVKNGLDRRRFNLSAILPPEERRNIMDGQEQSKDRYVEMTLITVGR